MPSAKSAEVTLTASGHSRDPAAPHAAAWRSALSTTHLPTSEPRLRIVEYVIELGRRQQAATRMVPAQQRLEADRLRRVERDDRLIDEPQLARRQSALNVAPQLIRRLERGAHLRHVELKAVATQILGAIEREVGVLEQLARPLRVGRIEAEAHADRAAVLHAANVIGAPSDAKMASIACCSAGLSSRHRR